MNDFNSNSARKPEQKSKNNNPPKKSNKKKKPSKAAVVLFGFLSTCVLTVLVVVSYVLINVVLYVNGDIVVNLDEYKANQNQTSFIYAYDKSGNTVEIARLHGEEDRVWVDLDDMSPYIKDAVIALEDTRFEKHHGVDWIRTIGVIVKPQNLGQGGSTITQQLIKNLTNNKEVTVVRKFYEILSALNLEENYDKDTILEAYLNTLYLGSGCYGVKTASEKYFGKDISELNAAECAVLVSITKAPTKYNPLINPDKNRERQVYCLDEMKENGALTEEEYNQAINYKLIFTNSEDYVPKVDETQVKKENEEQINSFYVDYVRQCVQNDLMEEYGYSKQQAKDKILYGGLKIYAAVDLDIQETLEDVYVNRKSFPDLKSKDGEPVQSAMTIMDYQGRVVAIVGEAGEKSGKLGLNRAANSYRQPGSTIKPLATYAPAIEMNIYNYSSKVKDYAIPINGKLWPHNVDKTLGSGNNVTIEYAIQKSLNTVPARIINYDVGIDNSFEFIRDRFHLSKLDEKEDRTLSPLATGALTNGTTTVEMAAAYATFGNGGLYYKPYSYYKVTNSQGTQILLNNEQPKSERAISEETSDIMCELLQTVDTSYYGTASNVRKFQIMAKTGTTSSDKDRWFCAGTPYYVAAVWVGFDKPESLGVSVNPGGKIFMTVFDKIHKGLEEKEFPKSSGTVQKRYCRVTGKLAGSSCYSTGMGWYKITSMPSVCTSCQASSKNENSIGEAVSNVVDGISDNLSNILDEIIGVR
ncbi:MAG: transglycosylase domain-containing protein [Oscillospiraceae bacterium]|nr:transglycosylase domain-containing protein [Oscillospiraceae bacterium]